jgi:large subunit ribosomal protein L3
MGDVQVTIRNLEIVLLDEQSGVIAIKGAIPGPNGSLVRIKHAKLP